VRWPEADVTGLPSVRLPLTRGCTRRTIARMPRELRYQPRSGASPRPLLDKLGVTATSKVSAIGVRDRAFMTQLRGRAASVSTRARRQSDLIFVQIDRGADLARLAALRTYLKPAGAIWVIAPKHAPGRPVPEGLGAVGIIAAAKAAGLIDNKGSAFSDTHTALRLVIPRSARDK
jgi:hypothetical protein